MLSVPVSRSLTGPQHIRGPNDLPHCHPEWHHWGSELEIRTLTSHTALLLASPNRATMPPATTWQRLRTYRQHHGVPVIIAHRGGPVGPPPQPENTVAAFAQSAQAGVVFFETDVRVSKDGHLVAFHDSSPTRLTGTTTPIEDLIWDRIHSLRVDGTEPIPRLDQLWARFPGALWNIDLKGPHTPAALAALLDQDARPPGVVVASFSHRRLHQFRRITRFRYPTVASPIEVAAIMLLPTRWLRRWVRRRHIVAMQVPPRRFGLSLISPRIIKKVHRLGLVIHAWTINDATTMTELIQLGVDGIMTDNVGQLRALITGEPPLRTVD